MSLPEVKIEAFEGPFDLLLELAGRQKVDLSEISLAELTDDFLQYIKDHEVSVQAQGEWLVIAARLLLLKARLITQPDGGDEEEQEEEEHLRNRVRLYQLYRAKAELLRSHWGLRVLSHRGERQQQSLSPAQINSVELKAAFERVLAGIPKPVRKQAHLVRFGRTLDECLVSLRSVLKKKQSFVFQKELQETGRAEMAVSFLALLEMQRSAQARLEQSGNFEQIVVRRV